MTISSDSPSPDLLLAPDPHSQLLTGQCHCAVSLLLKLHKSLLEQSELSFPWASPPLSLPGGIPIYPVTRSRGKAAPQTPHSSLPLATVNGPPNPVTYPSNSSPCTSCHCLTSGPSSSRECQACSRPPAWPSPTLPSRSLPFLRLCRGFKHGLHIEVHLLTVSYIYVTFVVWPFCDLALCVLDSPT